MRATGALPRGLNEEQEIYERKVAAREFMLFLEKYLQLLQLHLDDVRHGMAATIQSLMDGIVSITQAGDTKKRQANAILIKGKNPDFVETTADDLAASEGGLGGYQEAGHLASAKEAFGTVMHSLKLADSNLTGMLMTMIGALSADDVVGQRLEHVGSGMTLLKSGLSQVLTRLDEDIARSTVSELRDRLSGELYKSYTMESEKEVFEQVFGKFMRKQ